MGFFGGGQKKDKKPAKSQKPVARGKAAKPGKDADPRVELEEQQRRLELTRICALPEVKNNLFPRCNPNHTCLYESVKDSGGRVAVYARRIHPKLADLCTKQQELLEELRKSIIQLQRLDTRRLKRKSTSTTPRRAQHCHHH